MVHKKHQKTASARKTASKKTSQKKPVKKTTFKKKMPVKKSALKKAVSKPVKKMVVKKSTSRKVVKKTALKKSFPASKKAVKKMVSKPLKVFKLSKAAKPVKTPTKIQQLPPGPNPTRPTFAPVKTASTFPKPAARPFGQVSHKAAINSAFSKSPHETATPSGKSFFNQKAPEGTFNQNQPKDLKSLDALVVLDCGGQYAHLIANRVRRLGVYCEIKESDTSVEDLRRYKGIILSGGPRSVYEKNAPQCDPEIFNLNVPILGICYGHQLIVKMLGGTVEPSRTTTTATAGEYGKAKLQIIRNSGVLKFLGDETTVWMSHGDTVTALPIGFEKNAYTDNCEFAAVSDEYRKIFGIQFHLEVTHTEHGMKMVENFVDLCKVEREWNLKEYIETIYNDIRRQVKSRKVFCLVSGGVDSTVTFALLEKALSTSKVHGLFIDTGFLRRKEADRVEHSLKKSGFNIHTYDAKQEFFTALAGVTEPEQKRKIIGNTFLEVQQKVSKNLKLNPSEWMLGQGTIYPDTIETGGTKHAAKIKTHHNRVPQIEVLMQKGLLIEPLKELYKDEVRTVGEKLGIEKELVWRHPFPGPGLAVRCLCAKKASLPENLKVVEQKIKKILDPHFLSGKVLPVRSVGVQGDDRSYKNPVVVSGEASWEVLQELATTIPNHVAEVNRVTLHLGGGSVENIEFKPGTLTPERIQLLQEVDALVMKCAEDKKLMRSIWQFPVILLPVSINGRAGETIVLRPICSEEAMTASPYLFDWAILRKLVEDIMKIKGVSDVLYDLTSKPPGTIEWE